MRKARFGRGPSSAEEDWGLAVTSSAAKSTARRQASDARIGLGVYHADDTNLLGDVALIGEITPRDLALLPIGGRSAGDPSARWSGG